LELGERRIVERRLHTPRVQRVAAAAHLHEERIEIHRLRGGDGFVSFLRAPDTRMEGVDPQRADLGGTEVPPGGSGVGWGLSVERDAGRAHGSQHNNENVPRHDKAPEPRLSS
jgi:hypothetical protein